MFSLTTFSGSLTIAGRPFMFSYDGTTLGLQAPCGAAEALDIVRAIDGSPGSAPAPSVTITAGTSAPAPAAPLSAPAPAEVPPSPAGETAPAKEPRRRRAAADVAVVEAAVRKAEQTAIATTPEPAPAPEPSPMPVDEPTPVVEPAPTLAEQDVAKDSGDGAPVEYEEKIDEAPAPPRMVKSAEVREIKAKAAAPAPEPDLSEAGDVPGPVQKAERVRDIVAYYRSKGLDLPSTISTLTRLANLRDPSGVPIVPVLARTKDVKSQTSRIWAVLETP